MPPSIDRFLYRYLVLLVLFYVYYCARTSWYTPPPPPIDAYFPPVRPSYQFFCPVPCWYISLYINAFVCWWKLILIAGIVSIVFCPFLQLSVLMMHTSFLSYQCILLSDFLLMCTSLLFVLQLIDQSIYWSIHRWILMFGVWNRHHFSPSPSICVRQ